MNKAILYLVLKLTDSEVISIYEVYQSSLLFSIFWNFNILSLVDPGETVPSGIASSYG